MPGAKLFGKAPRRFGDNFQRTGDGIKGLAVGLKGLEGDAFDELTRIQRIVAES